MSKNNEKSPLLKISVLKSGEIQVDGKKVSLEELDSRLDAMGQAKGSLWYYREAGQEEPPPQALQVIEIITKYQFPVRFSSKPDFSDYIDDQGNSIQVN